MAVEASPAQRAADERAQLDKELTELELLINQARTEAGRHESKRAAAAEKLTSLAEQASTPAQDLNELREQLITLTRRAVLMEAQVDVLTGKHKTLTRFRDTVAEYADLLAGGGRGVTAGGTEAGDVPGGPVEASQSGMSRVIVGAQEDLRREIARAMHDGPAQSLTNIVLQAQIVERLVGGDPEQVRTEVRLLTAMVQQTLDATKNFIFDVRPMVLDDLGLVPTIRRAARERGRRGQVAVDVESLGTDRRLPVEIESGLFRILDEALAAYVAGQPDSVSVRLDWGDDQVEGRVAAHRGVEPLPAEEGAPQIPDSADLPPALAAMVEDRRAARAAAEEAARVAAIVALPPATWRDVQQRAASIGVRAELLAGGSELWVVADVPRPE